jgi:hypothetical protein
VIIWLASYPKSGNTWLRAILHQIIKDTGFENLKSLEKKGHFLETAVNTKTKNKATFFNLGPKNDYRKLLDKEIQFKIEKKFKNTMKKLNYLK